MINRITLMLMTFALTSAVSPNIRACGHALQRSFERRVDLNRAVDAVNRGQTAWFVREEIREGQRRLVYEGYYEDVNRYRTYIRVVTDDTDNVITVIALDREPQRPVLTQEQIEKRKKQNEKRKNRGNASKECKDFVVETTTRFTRFRDELKFKKMKITTTRPTRRTKHTTRRTKHTTRRTKHTTRPTYRRRVLIDDDSEDSEENALYRLTEINRLRDAAERETLTDNDRLYRWYHQLY
jgi:hypothetical protein